MGELSVALLLYILLVSQVISREVSGTNPLTSHLLVDQEDEHGVCHDFLSEAISRFPEDESVQEALVSAVEELSRRLAKLSMNADYKPYVMVSMLPE